MQSIRIYSFLLLFLCCGSLASGEESSVEETIKAMKLQIAAMQAKIDELEAKVAPQRETVQAQAPMDKQGDKPEWLPNIAVVADIVYKQDTAKQDTDGADRVSVRELLLILGSEIDPYSRLDATIAFSDLEETALEEAYLTRFGLPFDANARFGKFKPNIGKALTVHRDGLETVDEPLVIQRYFGAEGYNKAGADITKTLNVPWPVAHEVSVGVLEGGNGEEGTIFGETRRRPTIYSHLKNAVDLNDATGFELGVSHMIGSRDVDTQMEVQVLGADAALTHELNSRQRIKLQGEAFHLMRQESMIEFTEEDSSVTLRDVDGTLWGAYGLLDLRVHPRWSTGFRYDYVQPVDNDRLVNPESAETGYTGYLTFHQSEFARWRAQFTRTDLITGKEDNAFMLQGTFTIGEEIMK